jgi:subfamily B ATP-binding cassette protein HlyB/CyaB
MPDPVPNAWARSPTACISFLCNYHEQDIAEARIVRDTESLGRLSRHSAAKYLRGIGLDARTVKIGKDQEAAFTSPLMHIDAHGQCSLIARVERYSVTLVDPLTGQTHEIERSNFGEGARLKALRVNKPHKPSASSLGIILQEIGRRRAFFTALIVATVMQNMFALVVPIAFMLILDKVILNKGAATLHVLTIALVIIATLEIFLRLVGNRASRREFREIDQVINRGFVSHLLSLPVPILRGMTPPDTISRLADWREMRRIVTSSIVRLSVDLVFVIFFVLLLFAFHQKLGLVVLLSIPVYLIASFMILPNLRRRLKERQLRRRQRGQAVIEALEGIEVIKVCRAESTFSAQIVEQFEDQEESSDETTDLITANSDYQAAVSQTAFAALVWIGALAVMEGSLTLGQLVAAYMINRRVARPLENVCRTIISYQHLKASLQSVSELMQTSPEASSQHRVRPRQILGTISFQNVYFHYPGSRQMVLNDLSFTVRPGQALGIIGPSGSGKSTVLKLLQGFYSPARGRITIDGHDYSTLQPHWIRRHLGVINQDCFIFSRSVFDNIALGRAANIDDVIAAAKLADAHDFVTRLPHGYETKIGVRGINLSQGERQRVALARAVLCDPKILLLDEATSWLDHEAEARIQNTLVDFFTSRTVIIVAHRLSLIRRVDQLISLSAGAIVEFGHPDEVLKKGGYFSRVVRDQLGLVSVPTSSNEARM